MPRPYMPEMDGLRAIAVFAVLVSHWFSTRLPIGTWGVLTFFVISGYLITGSLFSLRDRGLTLGAAAAQFFGRRALRLFPAFYVVLMLGLILVPDLRPNWLWHAFYASNVLAARSDHYITFGPTWSLAVEEQFYVGWFLVSMLLPMRRMATFMAALIAVAVVFRVAVFASGHWADYMLLPAQLDPLALGALLCVMERRCGALPRWAGWAAGVLLAAVCVLTLPMEGSVAFAAAWPLAISLVAAYAVWGARAGSGGPLGWLLGNPVAVYLGRISYGIYLYQMIATALPLAWRLSAMGLVGFAGKCIVIVALASASYYGLERPIMRLGRARTRATTAGKRIAVLPEQADAELEADVSPRQAL